MDDEECPFDEADEDKDGEAFVRQSPQTLSNDVSLQHSSSTVPRNGIRGPAPIVSVLNGLVAVDGEQHGRYEEEEKEQEGDETSDAALNDDPVAVHDNTVVRAHGCHIAQTTNPQTFSMTETATNEQDDSLPTDGKSENLSPTSSFITAKAGNLSRLPHDGSESNDPTRNVDVDHGDLTDFSNVLEASNSADQRGRNSSPASLDTAVERNLTSPSPSPSEPLQIKEPVQGRCQLCGTVLWLKESPSSLGLTVVHCVCPKDLIDMVKQPSLSGLLRRAGLLRLSKSFDHAFDRLGHNAPEHEMERVQTEISPFLNNDGKTCPDIEVLEIAVEKAVPKILERSLQQARQPSRCSSTTTLQGLNIVRSLLEETLRMVLWSKATHLDAFLEINKQCMEATKVFCHENQNWTIPNNQEYIEIAAIYGLVKAQWLKLEKRLGCAKPETTVCCEERLMSIMTVYERSRSDVQRSFGILDRYQHNPIANPTVLAHELARPLTPEITIALRSTLDKIPHADESFTLSIDGEETSSAASGLTTRPSLHRRTDSLGSSTTELSLRNYPPRRMSQMTTSSRHLYESDEDPKVSGPQGLVVSKPSRSTRNIPKGSRSDRRRRPYLRKASPTVGDRTTFNTSREILDVLAHLKRGLNGDWKRNLVSIIEHIATATHETPSNVLASCASTLIVLAKNSEALYIIWSNGGIEAFGKAWKDRLLDAALSEDICTFFAIATEAVDSITLGPSSVSLIIDNVIGPMFKFPENKGIQREAARTLCHLAYMNDHRTDEALMSSTGISQLVLALEKLSDDEEICTVCCIALRRLVNTEGCKKAITNASGIRVIVGTMMRFQNSKALQFAACGLLANLAQCPRSIQDLATSGGLRALVATIETFKANSAVVAVAINSLKLFVTEDKATQMLVLETEGLISAVLRSMFLHNQQDIERTIDVQIPGLILLTRLSCRPRLAQTLLSPINLEDLSTREVEKGVVPKKCSGLSLVVATMTGNLHRADVQLLCCGLLWKTIQVDISDELWNDAASKAAPKVVLAMRIHQADDNIQHDACGFLSQLAKRKQCCRPLLKCEATGAIVEAMMNHPNCQDIQFNAFDALSRLIAENEDLRGEVDDAVPAIFEALRDQRDNRDARNLSLFGYRILDGLAGAAKARPLISSPQDIATIVRNMETHQESLRIQESAINFFLQVDFFDSPGSRASVVRAILLAMENFDELRNLGSAAVMTIANTHKQRFGVDVTKVLLESCRDHIPNAHLQLVIFEVLALVAASNKRACEAIFQEGRIASVLRAMEIHDDNLAIQQHGFHLLQSLLPRIMDRNGPDDVRHTLLQVSLKAVRSQKNDVTVQRYVCRVLERLSKYPALATQICCSGGIRDLVAALNVCHMCAEALHSAFSALKKVSQTPFAQDLVLQNKGDEAIVRSLGCHAENPVLQLGGYDTLATIWSEPRYIKVSNSFLLAFKRTLDDHGQNAKVLDAAIKTLGLLAKTQGYPMKMYKENIHLAIRSTMSQISGSKGLKKKAAALVDLISEHRMKSATRTDSRF